MFLRYSKFSLSCFEKSPTLPYDSIIKAGRTLSASYKLCISQTILYLLLHSNWIEIVVLSMSLR